MEPRVRSLQMFPDVPPDVPYSCSVSASFFQASFLTPALGLLPAPITGFAPREEETFSYIPITPQGRAVIGPGRVWGAVMGTMGTNEAPGPDLGPVGPPSRHGSGFPLSYRHSLLSVFPVLWSPLFPTLGCAGHHWDPGLSYPAPSPPPWFLTVHLV